MHVAEAAPIFGRYPTQGGGALSRAGVNKCVADEEGGY